MNIKHELSKILNMVKNFEVGYNSSAKDKLIVDHEGKRYIVSFKEIENPSENMLDDIKLYLKK